MISYAKPRLESQATNRPLKRVNSTADLRLLGILNSRLAFFFFSVNCAALEGERERYLEFRAQYVRKFPLPGLPKPSRTDHLSGLVKRVIESRQLYGEAITERDKNYYADRFVDAEHEIDRIVYDLYRLTPDEVAAVEVATDSQLGESAKDD